MAEPGQVDLTTLTVELLSAFVSNNTIESGELSGLIQSTHTALAGINAPPAVETPATEYPPAVTIRKSLGSRDHILSLIDGKPYKTLKRHLSGHGLTPSEYRERYKLSADYPMVAPSYSEHRRNVAQRLGLGRKSPQVEGTAMVAEPTPAEHPVDVAPSPTSSAEAPGGSGPKAKAEKKQISRSVVKPTAKRAPADAAAKMAIDAAPLPDPVEPAIAADAAKQDTPTNAPANSPAAAKPKRPVSKAVKAAPKPKPVKRGRQKADSATSPIE